TTAITIIMNQFGNPFSTSGDAWFYTAGATVTNYEYLMFTDDTNLATVPIKFAQPPFSFTQAAKSTSFTNFDSPAGGDYFGPTNIFDAFGGWNVPTNLTAVNFVLTNGLFIQVTNILPLTNNLVSVVNDPSTALSGDAGGSNVLALANGTITRSLATI